MIERKEARPNETSCAPAMDLPSQLSSWAAEVVMVSEMMGLSPSRHSELPVSLVEHSPSTVVDCKPVEATHPSILSLAGGQMDAKGELYMVPGWNGWIRERFSGLNAIRISAYTKHEDITALCPLHSHYIMKIGERTY